MASLVPIIRPNVLPDIRPKVSVTDFPPPSQGTQDEDQGRTILTGSDGEVISLSYTFSRSMSKDKGREEKRQYDILRVYKVNENQTTGAVTGVNKNVYVDVETPHKIQIRQRTSKGPTRLDIYRQPKEEDYPNGNIEIRETNLVRENKE